VLLAVELLLFEWKPRSVIPVALASAAAGAARRLTIRYGDRQGLRTLDALQLAVALEVQDRVGLEAFVAADKVLCEVATLEGFAVLNPEQP
jgi:predicted nucleic acid-binding protein